jgi:hypothetical protein
MLFKETVAVYCENHMEHTNIVCGQNAEFRLVSALITNSNYGGFKELFSALLIS